MTPAVSSRRQFRDCSAERLSPSGARRPSPVNPRRVRPTADAELSSERRPPLADEGCEARYNWRGLSLTWKRCSSAAQRRQAYRAARDLRDAPLMPERQVGKMT